MEIGIEPLSHANNYRIVGRLLAFDDAPHLFLKSKQRCKGARDSAPGHHFPVQRRPPGSIKTNPPASVYGSLKITMRGFGLGRYLSRHPATAFSAVFEINAIGLWLFVSS